MLRKTLFIAAACALLGTASAQAAPREASKAASDLVASRPARLHPSPADAYVQHAVITTPDGLDYVPYTRRHSGLPVVGGDFVVVARGGKVVSTSVAQKTEIDVSTSPTAGPGRKLLSASGQLSLHLPGYGFAVVTLT